MYNITKKLVLIIIDILIVVSAFVFAVVLSNSNFYKCMGEWWYLLAAVVVAVVANYALGLYHKIWQYAGVYDLIILLASSGIQMVAYAVALIVSENYTIPWFVICTVFYVMFLFGSRLSIKTIDIISRSLKNPVSKSDLPRVMVIGAGSAGYMIINELRNSDKIYLLPVCALDDDPRKIGRAINGVRIVGKTSEVEKYAKEYKIDQIVIAMPSVSKKKLREIVFECQKTKCKIQALPGIYQMISGSVSISDIKDVDVADLLGRDQVKVNLDDIVGYIENEVVLVTGGGGSIGSELCRQIALHNPKTLVIIDIYENNAYDIQQELKWKHPELNLAVRIASVRDKTKIDTIFEEYRPKIVFHAAAHKHVPLMEDAPDEAVKNNVGGTYNVADAAGKFGTERFILISTDKAVNPTNVMGATKRICEMIIQQMDKVYATNFVAVRFGNVLGSNGSVIPLFKKQLAAGGPITITDKNIVRYFMTIPEAVSLVLQAGAYAKGGEIFVLDMGEPVKIYDMAVNMIKLSGLEPNKDIDIKIVGLRAGEKLYEERLMDEEGLQKTPNELISIGKPIKFDDNDFFKKIKELVAYAEKEGADVKQAVHNLVPTYKERT